MHINKSFDSQVGLGPLPFGVPADRDLTVTIGDIVPAGPNIWPSPRLEAAFKALADNLWRAMLAAPHFDPRCANECTGASCAAVEFLTRRGIRAMAISAVLAVADLRNARDRQDIELGADLPPEQGQGRHIVVLIREGHRRWLLESSLWQAQRPRFPAMPDLALVQIVRVEPVCGLETMMSRHSHRLMTGRHLVDGERSVQVGWFDKRHRREWESGQLASPGRARVVADILDRLS